MYDFIDAQTSPLSQVIKNSLLLCAEILMSKLDVLFSTVIVSDLVQSLSGCYLYVIFLYHHATCRIISMSFLCCRQPFT